MSVDKALTIDGWMTEAELRWLETIAQGKRVVEFGSWRGRSAVALSSAKRLFCVDTWCGAAGVRLDECLNDELPWLTFLHNTHRIESVHPIVCDLSNPELCDRLVKRIVWADVVFIDADHSKEGVLRDIETAKRLVEPGKGIICGHDYDVVDWYGVTEAVNEVFERIERPAGAIWVGQIERVYRT
jgi:cephalosporin hydroxylase